MRARWARDTTRAHSKACTPNSASSQAKAPPFTGKDLPRRDVHWVTPKLVAQVAFGEWARDGKLRQPRFLGLRDDKEARKIVREEPNG